MDGDCVIERVPQEEWEVLIREKHAGYIDWDEYQRLDDRSLNINTFRASYVLMGYALPEEAQCPTVHRTGTAQA